MAFPIPLSSSAMSDLTNLPSGGGDDRPGDDKPIVQSYTHQPVGARVPEKSSRGVYSTGQLVLDSPKEFVIDFLQGLTRPHQVVARVVVTPQTMQEFINALQLNLDNFTRTFGAPPPLPTPPTQQRPSIEEIYQNYKLSEEMSGGTYANSVLIGHGVTEFFLDFISGFYPHPAVGARLHGQPADSTIHHDAEHGDAELSESLRQAANHWTGTATAATGTAAIRQPVARVFNPCLPECTG